MKGLSPHLIWLLVFYFTAYASTYSQGWEQTFGNPPTAMGREGIQTSDGGYIFTGDPGGGGTGPTVKTDYLGNAEWTIPHAGTSIQQTFDGGYIIAGGSNNGFLKKIDEMGNLTWTRYYGNTSVPDIASYVEQTLDSGYIVCGALYINGTQGLDYFLVKTDVNGDTLWSRTYGGSGSDWANEVHQTSDGGFVLVGRRNSAGGVIKTDALGNIEWETNFTPYGDQSIQQTFDGGYIVAGAGNLTKLNSSGQEIWANSISGSLYSVKQTFDGGYVCAGRFGNNQSFYLLKTDTSGNKEWDKTFYGGPDNETAESVHLTNDGGYILCGYRDFGTGNVSMYVVKTDAYGNTFTNVIDGYVYMDSDSNCVKDSGEVGLANRLVYISPANIYAATDATGYYSAMVGQGNYTVRQLGLNSTWNLSCPNPPGYYIVNFASTFDTTALHFGNQAAQDCPLLTVDIGTWALRPCTTSVYTVKYCNNGTIDVNNVSIEIEFDDDISPTSSTIPWSSQNGNFYQFNIGSVPFNQCGSFQIQALVSCDVIMGSTHCVTAIISPDSLCTIIDSIWDRSSVEVVGYCNNDSLACFKITNTGDPGSGDMQGPSEYRIYQNNMLIYTDNIQLAGGDSTEICWPANGHTIRLETDQRPGHPGNSQPRDHVELCGSPYLTLGQINLVPEDDVDPSIEIHCIEVTGSFDPNDKHVNPVGVKDQHIIDSVDVLEYQINFQNTGTDTAFKVIIKDAINPYLELSTIELGASSHNYTFSIKTSRILQFTFDNILLPDSNTNEPESHGFVRFKIHQKQGNALGTVIENSAGIFFDFNDPVITNTVFNTVGDLDSAFCYIIASYTYQVSDSSFAAISTSENASTFFWDFDDGSTSTQQNPTHSYASPGIYNVIHAVSNQCGTDTLVTSINVQYTGVPYYDEVKLMVKVQPNPFSTSTIISITGLTHASIIDFELFDIVGNRVIEMRGITGDHFQVSRGSLSPGTYFYKLRDDRQKVGVGKLIVL